MFCRSCGTELAYGAVACVKCGLAPHNGRNFCPNCGAGTNPQAIMCVSCGVALHSAVPQGFAPQGYTREGPAAYGGPGVAQSNNKIAAGICGIFLGCFGIHKYILGYSKEGTTMLLISLLGSLVTFGMAFIVISIIGFVEGIIYLTKSDEEFMRTYVYNQKGWF